MDRVFEGKYIHQRVDSGVHPVSLLHDTTGFYLEISGDLYPVMDVVLMKIGHDDEFEEQ